MILKGSQRGGGQDLAAHLMRMDENDHVLVHELRGFAADDLKGAFKEAEAISRGTKCRQYLFSLSLNPPEGANVSMETFEDTLSRVEERLGLQGQPRAVVIHEKEGRRHMHCVWSRIDAATMTARPLSFFKKKLVGLTRDLYLEHGWKMPAGLVNAAERNPTNFSLAEWQQAKRQGMDPRWLKSTIQECWKRSDSGHAFGRSLEEHGFFLAKGDKRSLVVVDHSGEVHSLPRLLGMKTKEVQARLGDGSGLQSVADAKRSIGERMTPAIQRHIEQSRGRFRQQAETLGQKKEAMTRLHREARLKLVQRQDAEWLHETRERADRLPRGVRGLWHRITGQYQALRAANEVEANQTRVRHAQERQTLADAQLGERRILQNEFKNLRGQQAALLLDLRRDVGRFLKFKRSGDAAMDRGRALDTGLKLQR